MEGVAEVLFGNHAGRSSVLQWIGPHSDDRHSEFCSLLLFVRWYKMETGPVFQQAVCAFLFSQLVFRGWFLRSREV